MRSKRTGSRSHGGADETARSLIELVSALAEDGDCVSEDVVAWRLGVPIEEAHKLVTLLLEVCAQDHTPMALTEEDGLYFLQGASSGHHGRALRLTPAETRALELALGWVGLTDDDPLRTSLAPLLADGTPGDGTPAGDASAKAGPDADATPASFHVPATDAAATRAVLAAARAMALGRGLRFSYVRVGGTDAQRRQVDPYCVYFDEGRWYVDAHDRDRDGAERSFRAERMSDLEVEGGRTSAATTSDALGPEADAGAGDATTARTVHIVFHEPRYLDILPWHGLKLAPMGPAHTAVASVQAAGAAGATACTPTVAAPKTDGDTLGTTTPTASIDTKREPMHAVKATTTWYGNDWLPHMLCACGGTATTDDPELAARMRTIAAEQLAQATD